MSKTRPAGQVILASTSPRRSRILALLGIPFQVIDPGIVETPVPGKRPADEAAYWALRKAEAVAAGFPDAVVIGGDTLIDLDGEKIGKPRDAPEASDTLKRLSGRTHLVVSGVAGAWPEGFRTTSVETVTVRMRPFSEEEIQNYILTGEPMDKAGAYSIQGGGARFIEGIEGDYLATVGLPLRAVAGILREAGLELPVDPEDIYRERNFLNWRDFDPSEPL